MKHTKGIYLITDAETGGQHVGAAHGEQRVWSCWRIYMDTGHEDNAGFMALLDAVEATHGERPATVLADAGYRNEDGFGDAGGARGGRPRDSGQRP